MDFSAVGIYTVNMRHQPHCNWLRDDLWSPSGAMRRSAELTPVKANRFFGPRNRSWSPLHDFWELGAVIAGQGELLHAGGETIQLGPGVVFLVPPQRRHGEDSRDNIDIVFIGLRGALLDGTSDRKIRRVENDRLAAQAEEFWRRAVGQAGGLVGPTLDGLARGILAEFMRSLDARSPAREARQIEDVARLMRQRLAEDMSVTDLARRMRLSADYFSRLFKQHTGSPPGAYLAGLRMQQAMQLLEHSELPVSQVANGAGYADPLYFSRAFRRAVGCSPLQYRRRIRPAR